MNFNLSLTSRYVLYLAGIMAVLLVGTLFITSTVVRSGFTDLFSQRMSKCKDVLEQYSQLQKLQTLQKLEAVLTSPRFLAAVATGDYGTIHREMPTYRSILDADFVLISDQESYLIYSSQQIDPELLKQLAALSESNTVGASINYIIIGNIVFEMLRSEIVTNDGVMLGQLISGTRFSGAVASQLSNLTGFDVLFSREGTIFGLTDSRLTDMIAKSQDFFNRDKLVHKKITQYVLFGEEIIYLAMPSSYANVTVTFVGSLDEYLAPIMYKVRIFLIALSAVGGLAAVLAVYAFTKRRIGRQIDALVEAAEKIAAGDMKFEIKPLSNDELGYLASEFEHMRSRLIASRIELENAHEIRVKSERLTATGKFAAGIIHDLKNPLAVVRASTELMQMKFGDEPKVAKHILDINKQVDRMLDLTRDILEYSRGHTRLELKPVNIKEFFREAAEFHNSAYKKRGISLLFEGETGLIVNIDPNRFRRVIDNLLNNAREALKPGDKVTIQCKKGEEKLEITISDNGPGIPDKIRDSLFEPFVTAGKENGTGLGLAVAKKIVEDHGASISFESNTGMGTTFKIELPIALVEAAKGEMAASI